MDLTSSPLPSECIPDLSSCPPIFVLPTHLSLEELHSVEERLLSRGARLTYDATEAALFLGNLSQKKRTALELRSRGVWTEEVHPHPRKRRRIERDDDSPGNKKLDPADLSETEEGEGYIKVVKLDWLDKSIEAGKSLSLHPFLVYQARKIPPQSDTTKPKALDTSQIMRRAREDAASHPDPTTRKASRHPRGPDGTSSQRPPKLYRQTTSEHDEPVPLNPVPDWVKNNVIYACMRSAPLHPPNESFMNQLIKIRKIRELTLDEIGVRAYSTSIAAIAAYPYAFRSPSEVLTVPGCEAKIANLFAEFQDSQTGTVEAAAALDNDPVLRVLAEFNRIWGVGAKTARDFYYRHHWRDLDDIVEHGWNNLSRVQQIGVKFFDEFLEGIPRPETEGIAATIARHAKAVRPNADYDGHGIESVIVGGYRRGKELSGDVDLILSHRDESVTKNLVVDVVASLEAEGWITHTLALYLTSSARDQQTLPFRGDVGTQRHFDSLDKALVVWQDPNFSIPHDDTQSQPDEAGSRRKNPNPHRRVDIIISPWRTVGCAVLGWSGDTTFERDLRRFAKKRHGWKFDSSGVRERTSGGRVIDLEREGRTWEERERLVLEGIGVGWREPVERCTR